MYLNRTPHAHHNFNGWGLKILVILTSVSLIELATNISMPTKSSSHPISLCCHATNTIETNTETSRMDRFK